MLSTRGSRRHAVVIWHNPKAREYYQRQQVPDIRHLNSALHVLTLTPFFPSDQNEVSGCFVAEPIEQLRQFGVDSSVIAASPIYYTRKHSSSSAAAEWVRYA